MGFLLNDTIIFSCSCNHQELFASVIENSSLVGRRQEFLKIHFCIEDSQHKVDGSMFYTAALEIVIIKTNKDKLLH